MMPVTRLARITHAPFLLAALALAACSDSDSSGVDIGGDFQAGPASFPAGSEIAVLQGDPSQTGPYTVRLRFPGDYQLPPHFHPTDENVTVIDGTFLVGMGDAINLNSVVTLGPGGFITAPAGGHHFAVARGQTIVQVHGEGPFAITYVNPADDPATARKAAGTKATRAPAQDAPRSPATSPAGTGRS
jgi:mannose-6-phosphate isomerase-like protein (cupin superfamily)